MPLFEFNAEPLDLADYPRALASLREPSLLAEIQEISWEQDLPRLRVALEAGVFDAQPFIDKALANPPTATAMQDYWVARCSAMMAVMSLVKVSTVAEGAEGRRYPLEFNLSDDTQDFLVEFIDHLAVQAHQWRDRLVPTVTDASAVAVNQAMHLACMLDRPEALQTLLTACRSAVHLSMSDAKLGGGMSEARSEDGVTMEVTTLFTAMQFSSPRCVEKLMKEVGDDLALYLKKDPDKANETVGFLKSFSDIQHRGSTAAMVPVMAHVLSDLGEEDKRQVEKTVLKTVEEILDRKGGMASRNTHVIPACEEAGWFDIDPQATLRSGLRHGHAQVVDHFKDTMPWGFVLQLGEDLGQTARRALEDSRSKGYQALATIARNDGPDAADALLKSFAVEGQMREGMAHALVRRPCGRELLPKLLAIGLDPHWKVPEDGKTLIEYAKATGSESFNVMTSFLARGRAHDLIAEMDAETRKPQP